jgi:hypothetical protein
LAEIQEGDSLAKIRDGHCLGVESADVRRRRGAERFDVAGQHRAPARFIPLNGPHQLGYRTALRRAGSLERNSGSSTLGLKQLIEKSDQVALTGKAHIGIVGFVHRAGR